MPEHVLHPPARGVLHPVHDFPGARNLLKPRAAEAFTHWLGCSLWHARVCCSRSVPLASLQPAYCRQITNIPEAFRLDGDLSE